MSAPPNLRGVRLTVDGREIGPVTAVGLPGLAVGDAAARRADRARRRAAEAIRRAKKPLA